MSFIIPANAGDFFKHIAAISSIDFIETNDMMTKMFDLPPSNPINEKFETVGFETGYFINDLGTFAFVLAFKFLLIIVWTVLIPFQNCSRWLRKRLINLEKWMLWNSWIITIYESFLIVGLTAMVALKTNFNFDSWGQSIQTSACIFIASIYVALTLFAYFKSMVKFDDLAKKEMLESVGAFYQGRNLRHGRKVLL